jgi:phosphoribosylpyrophosphate synthetase
MAKASAALRSLGAEAIYAVCVHALMVKDAERRLYDSGVLSVFGSNTIESRFAKFSVTKELANTLKFSQNRVSQSAG